jgi:hypothetical protein
MAAPHPDVAPHDQHDYQALLSSLLGPHLFHKLDRADKLALRGVGVQLRDEADRCFVSLDCSGTIKTEKEIHRMRALLGRMEGLKFLTLRSLEAVDAVFNEDGSHACGPQLQDLAIKLSLVSTSTSEDACMGPRRLRAACVHALTPSHTATCRRMQTRWARLGWPPSARGPAAG